MVCFVFRGRAAERKAAAGCRSPSSRGIPSDRGMISDSWKFLTDQQQGYLLGVQRRRNPRLQQWLDLLKEDRWRECRVGITAGEKKSIQNISVRSAANHPGGGFSTGEPRASPGSERRQPTCPPRTRQVFAALDITAVRPPNSADSMW